MVLSRRDAALAASSALLACFPAVRPASAQFGDRTAVNEAVDALQKAMIEADRARLDGLLAEQLSYGHSSGVVENKAQFLDVVAGRKTVYRAITLSDASVVAAGENAIARHIFSAETETDGKPGLARVGVMQVWRRQDGRWKLLARQAFRLP